MLGRRDWDSKRKESYEISSEVVQELEGGEAFLSEREGWIVLGFDAARWDSGPYPRSCRREA
jgi:hypothetical protein